MDLEKGQRVADRYEVIERLGEGAMGAVYRVEHVYMRKPFALKVLHGAMSEKPDIVARFEREAIAAGKIDHPNVAAATDFGRLPDGAFFLVLELVVGTSLRKEIARGPIAPLRALPIFQRIVAGLAAAHAKNIIHRDLKPENVMLTTKDGEADFVKILDFGIAKLEPEQHGDPSQPLTKIGVVMGTPEYMPPEQALGQAVDARADLYSLGVIFYEMLVGECPFPGGAALIGQAPPLPESVKDALGENIAAILAKLLEKLPEKRFQSSQDLIAELDRAMRPATAKPPPTKSRRPWLLVAALSVVAIGIGAFLIVPRNAPADEDGADNPPLPSTSIEAPIVTVPDPDPIEVIPSATAKPSATVVASVSPPSPTKTTTTTTKKTTTTTTKSRKERGPFYIPPPKDWFK